ncbi:hypothetical protein ILUMI_00330 [Ignelater luminosus]|uniref:DDE Tnp4 domain-containing protein n=1 Tax=Ignelater luminosus TaxID=2038154 RepID=A0A8K0GQC2_IGNLU|nr:hypothetical protein ILUMI_00330 [Ignelater luminosus]
MHIIYFFKLSRIKPSEEIEEAPSTSYEQTPSTSYEQTPSTSYEQSSTLSQPEDSVVVLKAENYLLKLEVEKKENIISHLSMKMSCFRICENDKLIFEYTGLPTRNIFDSLYCLIENININYYPKWKVEKIDRRDQLLMTFMKLRQSYFHTDLGYRFQVSEATVTNVVVKFIHLLYEVLYVTLMKSVPKRSKNKSCLPNCAGTFTNCRIIIDFTEVFAAVPRQSTKTQGLTYSSYKHRNTLKRLMGVAPNGVVTYVSDLYPGSTSYKQIVANCSILNELEPGDLVIVDKGFLIKDLLPNGVALNVPSFLSTPQFTAEQVQQTERIAKARIFIFK